MVAIGPENTAAEEEREQTRKRRRLTWDVAPLSPENQAAEVRFGSVLRVRFRVLVAKATGKQTYGILGGAFVIVCRLRKRIRKSRK